MTAWVYIVGCPRYLQSVGNVARKLRDTGPTPLARGRHDQYLSYSMTAFCLIRLVSLTQGSGYAETMVDEFHPYIAHTLYLAPRLCEQATRAIAPRCKQYFCVSGA